MPSKRMHDFVLYDVPQEYLQLLQELQSAQQQQQSASQPAAQHRYVLPSHSQSAGSGAPVQYAHAPQVQLVSSGGSQQGPSTYALQQQQHAQATQQLQQIQLQHIQQQQQIAALQQHQPHHYPKPRPTSSPYVSQATTAIPRHQHISALADSTFEKELAQLVASNRAQEQAQQQQSALRVKQYQPKGISAAAPSQHLYQGQQAQYSYISEQEQQQGNQIPQYVHVPQQQQAQQQYGYQDIAQGGQSYVAPKLGRKPTAQPITHQYLAETTGLSGKASYEQRPQYAVPSQSPYAVQYRVQQPIISHQPTTRYQPQATAASKIPTASPEDQEFLKSLFENQAQGFFQGAKQPHQQPQASRSSIYVSQTQPTSKSLKPESSQDSSPNQLPPIRLPGPKDRPLTQDEFQALVNAGYSVTPIPVPVPVPVPEDKYNQQKYQQQQRGYAQPEPEYQQQRYQPVQSVAPKAAIKQRRLVRPPQGYRLNDEQPNASITYLVPLDQEQQNREYSGRRKIHWIGAILAKELLLQDITENKTEYQDELGTCIREKI
ncbi:putative uncharacterized protein DDB_G0271606 [Ctenocephalides felis]|uniref:putative uncharacterized protein DDB_G0271606 n=1 Tax=Ctenocephalides felis TaxID=7515 RepID=UPI000E6E2F9E|nr:putative uncharacterized protein DDB_G0271606 [Ctenocephalides felis]